MATTSRQADSLQGRSAGSPIERPIRERSSEDEVLLEIEERHEVLGLEDDPDAGSAKAHPVRLVGPRQVQAVDDDAASRGSIRPGKQAEERRLAGAGSAHEGQELTLRDLEVDAAERDRLDIHLAVDLDLVRLLDCSRHQPHAKLSII